MSTQEMATRVKCMNITQVNLLETLTKETGNNKFIKTTALKLKK